MLQVALIGVPSWLLAQHHLAVASAVAVTLEMVILTVSNKYRSIINMRQVGHIFREELEIYEL